LFRRFINYKYFYFIFLAFKDSDSDALKDLKVYAIYTPIKTAFVQVSYSIY